MAKRQYVIVVEQAEHNWSAYAPDVWGCVTVGDSREEVEHNMVEALEGHFACMQMQDDPIPAPGTWTSVVEVNVPESVPEHAR